MGLATMRPEMSRSSASCELPALAGIASKAGPPLGNAGWWGATLPRFGGLGRTPSEGRAAQASFASDLFTSISADW